MSYICYLNDRKTVGFKCIKDNEPIVFLKTSTIYFIKSNSINFILLQSRTILIGIFFFIIVHSLDSDINVDNKNNYRIYQNRISKSNFLKFKEFDKSFKASSLNSCQNLNIDTSTITDKELDKLAKSIIAKCPNNLPSERQISINKRFKKIFKKVKPIIGDIDFWKKMNKLCQPIKKIQPNIKNSTDIL